MTTSPIATSGAGGDLEADVAASYLAQLLLGSIPRGSETGVLAAVSLQQGPSGVPLDDVVLRLDVAVDGARCAYQVKRTLVTGAASDDFIAIVRAAWGTIHASADFAKPASRVGIVVALPTQAYVRHYPVACARARASQSANEYWEGLRPGVVNEEARAFAEVVRGILGGVACTDGREEAWRLLRQLALLAFDANGTGGYGVADSVEALRAVAFDGTANAARVLFTELQGIARAQRQAAGTHTQASLLGALAERGIRLRAPLNLRPGIERLQAESGRVLIRIRRDVAGQVLPRTQLLEEARGQLASKGFLLLRGDPGVGKSGVLRSLVENAQGRGSVLLLDGRTLRGVVGWSDYAGRLGITGGLEALVAALAAAGPCLLAIDGLDRIDDDAGRAVVLDLLAAINALGTVGDEGAPWRVAATSRSESSLTVGRWLRAFGGTMSSLSVAPLTLDEVRALALAVPALGKLLSLPELPAPLRTPLMLEVLASTGISDGSAIGPQSECEIAKAWWDEIVGPDSGRKECLLALGEASLREHEDWLPVSAGSLGVLVTLATDGVLRRDQARERLQWAHDRFGDWVMARVCARRGEEVFRWLHELGDPYWVEDGLALFLAGELEAASDGARWLRLQELAAAAGGRWTVLVERAPLNAGGLGAVLDRLEAQLWADDARLLVVLLRGATTTATSPDIGFGNFLRAAGEMGDWTEGEIAAALAAHGVPVWRIWVPLLEWLATRLDRIPPQARGELVQVALRWLNSTARGDPFRAELGRAALRWLGELQTVDGRSVLRNRAADAYAAGLREMVMCAADGLGTELPAAISLIRQLFSQGDLARWLAATPACPFYTVAPGMAVDLVLDVLFPRYASPSTPEEVAATRAWGNSWDREVMGIEVTQAFLNPSHLRGPFLGLLRADPTQGLRLVRQLCDAVTRETAAVDPLARLEVPIELPAGRRVFVGEAQSYSWYRPQGNGPYPVASALMALEVWMEVQLRGGADPGELFQQVLGEANSLALVGVCVGVALGAPETCAVAAVPFLKAPAIWDLDLRRAVRDRSVLPMFSTIFGGVHDPVEAAARQRDQMPHRVRDLSYLAPRILFRAPPDALREQLKDAMARFSEDRSLLPVGQRDDAAAIAAVEDRLRLVAAYGDERNYEKRAVEGGFELTYVPPADLAARHQEKNSALIQEVALYAFAAWGEATLAGTATPQRMAPEEALAELSRMRDDPRWAAPDAVDSFDDAGLNAMVLVSAALLLKHRPVLAKAGELGRIRDEVTAFAGTAPLGRDLQYQSSLCTQLGAIVRVFTGLLLDGDGTPEVEAAWWRIATEGYDHGLEQPMMASARDLWVVCPALAQGFAVRAVALARMPRGHWFAALDTEVSGIVAARARLAVVDQQLADWVQGRTLLDDAVVCRMVAACWQTSPGDVYGARNVYVQHAVGAVPPAVIGHAIRGRPWRTILCEALDETIREWQAAFDARAQEAHDYGWKAFVGGALAELAVADGTLPEIDAALNLLRTSWPISAEIVAEVVLGINRRVMGGQPLSSHGIGRLLAISKWLLPEEPIATERWREPRNEQWEAYCAILGVYMGRVYAPASWPPTALLPTYQRWAAVLGQSHHGFRTLLAFFSGSGRGVPVRDAVMWIADAAARAPERSTLWRTRGAGTAAAAVLKDLKDRDERAITSDATVLAAFIGLLDDLSGAGVPLAAQLRASM